MKRLIFLFISVTLINTLSMGNNTFIKGVNEFKSGEIDSALTTWLSIDGESASLHYNIGNAYYIKGIIGKSILHYEKSLRLNPKDDEVMHNLAVANGFVVDEIEVLPPSILYKSITGFLKILSSNGWLYIGLFFLIASLGFWTLFLQAQHNKKRYFTTFVISSILGITCSVLSYLDFQLVENKQYGIVTNSNVYVKSGPTSEEKDSFILHEGTKCEVKATEGKWFKIKLADGKIGWLPSASIAFI